jgi:3-hydroxyisobutyrate dehydrogenase-like beta-hydroxyacid dehydrogenase
VKPLIAIVAQGTMAAALGARLVQHGIQVRTTVTGRSAASQRRAAAAGMTPVDISQLLEADILLSVLPPVVALAYATALAPALKAAPRKPLYVDCNAVSFETARSIAQVIQQSGCEFVDVGIIGMPPKEGYSGPRLYVSGPAAQRLLPLREFGLDIAVLDGDVGEASALKMSYAGITKGLTAVATTMILAATRAGLASVLRRELAESEPLLYSMLARRVPDMLPKAYRWVDEMRQIQAFVSKDVAASEIFQGAAQLYERIAQDQSSNGGECKALEQFFKAPAV